ncbi:winged helix-turn-helix domain-containing protein [Streptomyces sp. NPDC002928]|uniref:winged helix-turn-helix domain-containing protein n=1 Tax=Streptomyces sp. NPDC002928 TaxID=3154440 RepID=UPI0033A76349
MRAADLFEEGVKVACIARELRVSEKSVYEWRRAWELGGRDALCSKGPPGYDCRLRPDLQVKLAAWLDEGPAGHGWTDDQVWTAARVRTLIGRKSHVSYSVSGVTRLLHRMGFSMQVLARPAADRDEDAITAWREATWQEVNPAGGDRRVRLFRGRSGCDRSAAQGPYLGSARDHPDGARLRPWPWAPVGGRAAVLPARPARPPVLRLRRHTGRKGERRSLGESDYIHLLDGAHHLFKAPLIVVWDRLSTRTSKAMKALVAEREWLTVVLLPGYAPEVNPVQGMWAHIKRSLANLAARTLGQLETLLRRRLKAPQYRHSILGGFLAGTGLALDRPN